MRAVLVVALFLAACSSEPPAEESDEAPAQPSPEAEAAAEKGPEEVLRAYYDAIARKEYQTAWELWGNEPGGDRSFADFARGFEDTELTAVELGEASPETRRSGFLYVDIPVVVEDLMSDGSGQRYEGVYTLRRALESDEDWRIHAGDLDEAPAEQ